MIVTPNEDDVFTALTSFLAGVLPAGVETVQGQDNRVAEPLGQDFVVMTIIHQDRSGTNVEIFSDAGQTASRLQTVLFSIQLDVHGPNGSNNASVISTMFRTDYAADAFAASNVNISPLHADDPKQMPFNNGEQQVEDRFVIDAKIQVDQTVSSPQDSFTSIDFNIAVVDGDSVVVTDPTPIPQPS